MNETSINAKYSAFSLTIASDFCLNELTKMDDQKATVDISIMKEDLNPLWEKFVTSDSYYFIKENFCMVRVPNVALFKIEDGSKISYSPFEKANEDQIRLYLLGTCLGVVLMQRKILPIHGSCIVIDGKAYAIVGDSGAGKSTLASAFIKRGYQILTDDVIAVSLSNEKVPMIIPSYPQQKLWQQSLEHLGIESTQFKPIFQRETKFAVPVNEHFMDKEVPLAGIFELREEEQHHIEISPIKKLERLLLLYHHTYRNFIIHSLGLLEWHFNFTANMVHQLAYYRIVRPNIGFTANELVDRMLRVMKEQKIDQIEFSSINNQKGEKVI